jgi:transposase
MSIVAEDFSFVVGVDTHARSNTYAIIATRTGARLDAATFPNSQAGIAQALAWMTRRSAGSDALLVIEGIGSYGAALARAAGGQGLELVEAMPYGSSRRRGAKDDTIDAELIGRSVMGVDVALLRRPRSQDGIRTGLRVLVVAREELNAERTRSINALTALLRSHHLGLDARRALSGSQISTIARWRARSEELGLAAARAESIRLARRILSAEEELDRNRTDLAELVAASGSAHLLDEVGIGVVNAAVILVAWSHSERIRSEAAFASLSGTCPIPASSGNTERHRLNRGGDRRLNRALSSIALTRMSHDPETRAYVERRRSEGKTPKEIRRSLKRYIARQVYRRLSNPPEIAPAT